MKKLILLLFIFYLTTYVQATVNIVAKVDNEIITSVDVKIESEYLKILNPNISKLTNDKIMKLSKESLINEKIKRKEIDKFIDFGKSNNYLDIHLKNLYEKLNLKDENDFIAKLSNSNTYNLNDIKNKIKIELLWNELIYSKYKDQVVVNKEELIQKIKKYQNKSEKNFLVSEIVFKKKKNQTIEKTINEIILSINEIGFNNTANIYSISESSKIGGKIGWVNEKNLSKKILEELNEIKIEGITKVIKIGNDFIILKLEDIKIIKAEYDEKVELEKLIQKEINDQLNRFSRIYFDKSKINFSIYEK